eukprot:gene6674-7376_t
MMVPLLNPLRRPAVGPGGKAFVPNVNRVQQPPSQSVPPSVVNDKGSSDKNDNSTGEVSRISSAMDSAQPARLPAAQNIVPFSTSSSSSAAASASASAISSSISSSNTIAGLSNSSKRNESTSQSHSISAKQPIKAFIPSLRNEQLTRAAAQATDLSSQRISSNQSQVDDKSNHLKEVDVSKKRKANTTTLQRNGSDESSAAKRSKTTKTNLKSKRSGSGGSSTESVPKPPRSSRVQAASVFPPVYGEVSSFRRISLYARKSPIGIKGITLENMEGRAVIQTLEEDYANPSGLQVGDVVISVNHLDARYCRYDQIIEALVGPEVITPKPNPMQSAPTTLIRNQVTEGVVCVVFGRPNNPPSSWMHLLSASSHCT